MVRSFIAVFICLSVFAIVLSVDAAAKTNKGAEQITLDGGNRGVIPFPHKAHQDRLKDCMTCHMLFGQQKQAIVKAKADGRLAKKQVMNKLCIQCHRTEKKAGRPTGPTACAKCHQRG